MRVTKDPKVRRRELIYAAEALFSEKGCEQTSVSDIVKKVGVAQGTFYYYFKSKDDVLDAVLDHYLKDRLERAAREIMSNDGLNAMQKLQMIISTTLSYQTDEQNLIEFLYVDKNIVSHQKYLAKIREVFVPLITDLVEQGIREGVFEVKYPMETVDLMLVMFLHLHDSIDISQRAGDYRTIVKAAEDISAKVLGIKEGNIRLSPNKEALIWFPFSKSSAKP